MTVQTYPATPKPFYTYSLNESFQTILSDFEGQNQVAQAVARFAKREFVLGYRTKDILTEWYLIHDFFKARYGAYDPFWFVDPAQRKWTDEYVGRGTAGALTLDLHSKTTTVASLAIYEDGVAQVKDTDFTFVSGGGGAGSDRITWISGHYPAFGCLITSDFIGNLRIKGRLADTFSDQTVSNKFIDIKEIRIKEVQW